MLLFWRDGWARNAVRDFRSLILAWSVLVILLACDMQESRPAYKPIENIVPSGGRLIEWNEARGQLNMEEVRAGLDEDSKAVFSHSMDWYATESDLGFEYLSGKTAKQAVDVINCIKVSAPESQGNCVE